MNASVTQQLKLRVLIVEDNESDQELMLSELRREGFQVDLRSAQTEADFRQQVALGADIILSDYSLPSFRCSGRDEYPARDGVQYSGHHRDGKHQ
ncbi:MAG: response regulator [Pyrinomonadaceae bacterium]|nr:response regulator [Phycisphaerales bacterium]